MPTYRWGPNPIGNYQKVILPWHRPETPEQHEANVRALERIDWGSGQGTRWATIVIAASDSTALSKATADYVCPVGDAGATINTAITTLTSRASTTSLGRIVLLEGTYTCTTAIGTSQLLGRAIHIQGMGGGTGFNSTLGATRVINNTTNCFSVAGGSTSNGGAFELSDMQITCGAATSAVATIDCPLTLTRCTVTATAGRCISQTNTTGMSGGTAIYNNYIYCTSSGANAVLVDMGSGANVPIYVNNNIIQFTGAGVGVYCANNISTSPSYVVNDNYITGSSATAGVGIQLNGNSVYNCILSSNHIKTVGTGIGAAGYQHVIIGNQITACQVGIDSLASNPQYHYVVGNSITAHSTCGIRFGSSAGTVMDTGTIAYNKIATHNGAANAVLIGAGCTNCGVFGNDWFGGYATAALSDAGTATRLDGWFLTASSLPSHHTTHETGGSDALTGTLDANARVGVRKNGAGSTFLRRRINFKEGANVAITEVDQSGSEEVDVTIAVSGIAGTTTIKNNGATVGAESTINFIPGSGITYTMTNPAGEIDITITSGGTVASAAGEFNYLMHS